jgi:dienelactone hydrolase
MHIPERPVHILIDGAVLEGVLTVPRSAVGLVVFAHGSGSSRISPRNKYVASVLNKAGIGTLLVDLLTEDEDVVYQNRFDIELLTDRLVRIIEWVWSNSEIEGLGVGIFGASTGAAAALRAAATLHDEIKCVVCRGGRTDLSHQDLHRVAAPTLLIVGGYDDSILHCNEQSLKELCCEKKLEVIPGATHLFEEEGAMETVASLAASWYHDHFCNVAIASVDGSQ